MHLIAVKALVSDDTEQPQHETCKWVQIVWKETRASRRNSLRRRAEHRSIPRAARPATSLPSTFRASWSNPARTEAVSLRPAFRHFEVEEGADSEHRLNAFMAAAQAVYDGSTAVAHWHAADWPRRDGTAREKLVAHWLYLTLVPYHPPSENWRDYFTTVWRAISVTECINPGFTIVITIRPTIVQQVPRQCTEHPKLIYNSAAGYSKASPFQQSFPGIIFWWFTFSLRCYVTL